MRMARLTPQLIADEMLAYYRRDMHSEADRLLILQTWKDHVSRNEPDAEAYRRAVREIERGML